MKECILIVNHDTGEYRLEKLNSNIAVKKTRWVKKLHSIYVITVLLFETFDHLLFEYKCLHKCLHLKNKANLQIKYVLMR